MSENPISILVEPFEGRTDDEVVKELQKLGATDIQVLTKGFISAKLPKSKFGAFERVGHVHIKQEHKSL